MALLLWEDGSPRQLQDGFRLVQEGPGNVLTASGLTWNREEPDARTIVAGDWTVHVWIACAAGGSGNEIRVRVERWNDAGAHVATIIDEALPVTADATDEYSTTPVNPGSVTFEAGDLLLVIVADDAGAQAKTILFDAAAGTTGDSRLVHPVEGELEVPVVAAPGLGAADGAGLAALAAHGRALGAGVGVGDGAGLAPEVVAGVEIPAVLAAGAGDGTGAGLAAAYAAGWARSVGLGAGFGAGTAADLARGHRFATGPPLTAVGTGLQAEMLFVPAQPIVRLVDLSASWGADRDLTARWHGTRDLKARRNATRDLIARVN